MRPTLIRRKPGRVAVAVVCIGTTLGAVHAATGTRYFSRLHASANSAVITALGDPEASTARADASVAHLRPTAGVHGILTRLVRVRFLTLVTRWWNV